MLVVARKRVVELRVASILKNRQQKAIYVVQLIEIAGENVPRFNRLGTEKNSAAHCIGARVYFGHILSDPIGRNRGVRIGGKNHAAKVANQAQSPVGFVHHGAAQLSGSCRAPELGHVQAEPGMTLSEPLRNLRRT
jgi:hypothetical protein